MYKITKTINGRETINLVFDGDIKAKEIFSDLTYDEFVRFCEIYGHEFNKKTMEEIVNGELVCKEYKLSVPNLNVIITLEYI